MKESISAKRPISKCSACGRQLGNYAIHSQYYKYFSEDKKMKNLVDFICSECVINHSNTKKLYHVSFSCDIIETFQPRVPLHRCKDEDGATERICLSDSIEGCLTASPDGGGSLCSILWEGGSSLIRVYEFDINNIDSKNIVPPEYLYQKDLVRDAIVTREHWVVNQDLVPSETYLIKLHDYDEGYPDNISYENYVAGMIADEEGKRDFDWDEVINGHFTEIHDVDYEIVPDWRRSGIFRLNHEIEYIDIYRVGSIITFLEGCFYSANTWIEIENLGDKFIIIGELDTRRNEYDIDDMIDYVNSLEPDISIGKRLTEKEVKILKVK